MNQLSSLQEVNAHGYMEELKNFRVVKNLGRRVHSVHPFITPHMSGFEVEYIDGDYCLASPGQTYRSKVKYVCDPYGEENMVDYPLLEVPPTIGDYQGVNQCNFDFIWESRFACAPCTDQQVEYSEGFCQEDGYRLITITKTDDECVITQPTNGKTARNRLYSGVP